MGIRFFNDLVGNVLTISLIRRALDKKSLPGIILLEGVLGTGKSSCARLIALSQTCENPVDGEFCGKCRTCEQNLKALDESGVSPRIEVVNMAMLSEEGKVLDKIRDIFKMVRVPGPHVKILEEFHSLKESEFKLFLDETSRLPRDMTLILTTTKKRDIPKDMVSRCLTFNFTKLTRGESNMLVDRVNKKLKLTVGDYKSIYLKTGGVPRDIVLLVDFLSKTEPTREEIDHQLGLIGSDVFVGILATCDNFMDYSSQVKGLLSAHDIGAVYWQFRDFLNQLAFAIEGGIYDSLSKKDLEYLPPIGIQDLIKMNKIMEGVRMNEVEMELMFLRLRRILAKPFTVQDQKDACKQAKILNPVPTMEESEAPPLTLFRGGGAQ